MLAATSLNLTLGGTRVLDNVSVAVRPGQVTAIIGPNGAGKSSLITALAGLRRPDGGGVTLDATPLDELPPRHRAQRIGFLPQVAEVNWDIDVATLVALGRLPHQGRWGATAADHAAITAAMQAADINGLAGRIVTTLSGGERARALLARVLAGQPDYLLADEPLANLDPAHQLDTLACLRRAADAGTGIAIVLHDLAHASRIADRVVLMANGRIIADDTPDQVLTPAQVGAVYGVAMVEVPLPDGRHGLMVTGRLDG
jgi:iron complex transport system ATP-binding protein